jgi:riboflavin kinase
MISHLQLGIPTANIPVEGVSWIDEAESGVYFGWAGIQLPAAHPSLSPVTTSSSTAPPEDKVTEGWRIYPMVMSIGYNPFYKNKVRSAEVHVLHKFETDFYGSEMAISILGYIRPEYDYVSVEALIEDINTDIEVSKRSLEREAWQKGREDRYLWGEE